MTYKSLSDDSQKILFRSRIKSTQVSKNLRLDQDHGEERGDIFKSPNQMDDGSKTRKMAVIDANDLIGRTFLNDPDEDGMRERLKNH